MPRPCVAVAQTAEVVGDVDRSVEDHVRLAGAAADRGVRMVVFPELSLTGYSRTLRAEDAIVIGDRRFEALHRLAHARRITIVVGAPVVSPRGLHIGAISIGVDGACTIYEKEHLHAGEEEAFVPGCGGPFPQVSGESVSLAICADIMHPEHARAASNRGATIYAAGCFVTERGYSKFEANLEGYAKEHRMLVLMSNYAAPTRHYESAGRSAIWSPSGVKIACARKTGEALVVVQESDVGWTGEVLEPRAE